MKLNDAQKAAVLAAKGDGRYGMEKPELVGLLDRVACLWREPGRQPADRWWGQLVRRVDLDPVSSLLGIDTYTAWFDGSSLVSGKTHGAVVDLLMEYLNTNT